MYPVSIPVLIMISTWSMVSHAWLQICTLRWWPKFQGIILWIHISFSELS